MPSISGGSLNLKKNGKKKVVYKNTIYDTARVQDDILESNCNLWYSTLFFFLGFYYPVTYTSDRNERKNQKFFKKLPKEREARSNCHFSFSALELYVPSLCIVMFIYVSELHVKIEKNFSRLLRNFLSIRLKNFL